MDGDGSWLVGADGAIEAIALDAPAGVVRRIAAVVGTDGTPTVVASEETGLSAGDPDAAPNAPGLLDDLELAGTVLRSARATRAAPDGARVAPGGWIVPAARVLHALPRCV